MATNQRRTGRSALKPRGGGPGIGALTRVHRRSGGGTPAPTQPEAYADSYADNYTGGGAAIVTPSSVYADNYAESYA